MNKYLEKIAEKPTVEELTADLDKYMGLDAYEARRKKQTTGVRGALRKLKRGVGLG